jgi:nucleoside-diphosphate-sugar epimerase
LTRVLVTGATGFIGGCLADRLTRDGYRVRALVRSAADAGRLERNGAEVVQGDLRDPPSLERAAADCAHVYHVAALTSNTSRSKSDLEATNVAGSANIATAAARAGVRRFVHVSSCGVYGFQNRFPADETTPLRPDTPYRVSKARGERAVLECRERTGLPAVIARICATYGPGATNWVRICRSIRSGGFRMIGKGRNQVHIGQVTDIVDGLRRCAETPEIEGRCYNLAGAAPITMGELVETIREALDAAVTKSAWPAFPFRASRHLDLALTNLLGVKLRRLHSYDLFLGDRSFDTTRAGKELGYRPRVTAREGLRALVEDYRRRGLLDRD